MRNPSTIKLLVEWARWGQANNVGYPSMSPMFGERCLKAPLYGTEEMPPDVWLVERAVCDIKFYHRFLLILRYQRHVSFEDIGERFDCSPRTARRHLEDAEYAVDHEITKKLARVVTKSVPFTQDSLTAPRRLVMA
jgi:hypothetical protein